MGIIYQHVEQTNTKKGKLRIGTFHQTSITIDVHIFENIATNMRTAELTSDISSILHASINT